MRGTMNVLIILGAVLAVAGLAGLAAPVFFTQHTEDVARVGDLRLQTTETQAHVVPPLLGGGVLLLGVVLLGAGFYQRR